MGYGHVKPGTQLAKVVSAHRGGHAAMLLNEMDKLEGFGLHLKLLRDGEQPEGLYLKDDPDRSNKFSLKIEEGPHGPCIRVPNSFIVKKRRHEYAAHICHIARRGRGWTDRKGEVHREAHF